MVPAYPAMIYVLTTPATAVLGDLVVIGIFSPRGGSSGFESVGKGRADIVSKTMPRYSTDLAGERSDFSFSRIQVTCWLR